MLCLADRMLEEQEQSHLIQEQADHVRSKFYLKLYILSFLNIYIFIYLFFVFFANSSQFIILFSVLGLFIAISLFGRHL